MKPPTQSRNDWLDTAANLLIGLGLGYLLLRRLETAAAVAWALCGVGAAAKLLAAWRAARID